MTIDEIKGKYGVVQNDVIRKGPSVESALSTLKATKAAFDRSMDDLIKGVQLGVKDHNAALKYMAKVTSLGKMLETIPKPIR
ncbi:MAG: hypothetical protein IKS96_07265 [Fibrobacter sp.]|nr:hypothetical protein [Fibrobacter sp.]MBR6449727.1 hypothetical protein [Fibrobacter sp.]